MEEDKSYIQDVKHLLCRLMDGFEIDKMDGVNTDMEAIEFTTKLIVARSKKHYKERLVKGEENEE